MVEFNGADDEHHDEFDESLMDQARAMMVGQPQKILVLVASWTWVSRPMTTSYLAIWSGVARLEDMFLHYRTYSIL